MAIRDSLRNTVCGLLFHSQLYRVIRLLRSIIQRREALIILAYHKVNDHYKERKYVRPHVRGLPVDEFRRQMAYLKRRHNVLSLLSAAQMMQNGVKLPKNAVAITLDDGYLDNYLNAYPILRSQKLPATFFLTTGFIGCRRPAWLLTLSAYLRLSPCKSLRLNSFDQCLRKLARAGRKFLSSSTTSLAEASDEEVLRKMLKTVTPDMIEDLVEECAPEPEQAYETLQLATLRDKAKARGILGDRLQRRPLYERELLLDILRVRLGLKGAIYVPFGEMLRWHEVREMEQAGMSFGAHTFSHAILTQVSRELAQREISQSKRRIEVFLKKPVTLFCYPNGKRNDFDEEYVAYLRRVGFVASCCTIPGSNDSESDLFALRRIGPSGNLTVFAMKSSGILT
ncbi:MAG: polysaccharide deacetylase family protein [bacterium]|nr:polysaccharide deacetylase family protein [bacterium]